MCVFTIFVQLGFGYIFLYTANVIVMTFLLFVFMQSHKCASKSFVMLRKIC